jgi:hypothetical protein
VRLTSALTLGYNRQLARCPTRLCIFEYHEAVSVIIIIFVQFAVVKRRIALRHGLL